MATKTNYRIDHVEKKITLNRGYYAKTQNPNNQEAKDFEKVRQQHSDYSIVVREPIKTNSSKRTHKDLTFDNMERYILSHDNAKEIMHEYVQLREAGAFYKSAYPVIKKWFLSKYPEVDNFGLQDDEQTADAEQSENTETQFSPIKIAS